ncbi:MAG TPA: ATP-binding protein [Holophaga sp.]|nr:ATP-binding protein [Holophaga sp.]
MIDPECPAPNLEDDHARKPLIFDLAPDGLIVVDPETARFLDFNEAAHRQLGYTREEFAGLDIHAIEASENLEETRARIAQVRREGRATFETLHRTRQGELRNVRVTALWGGAPGREAYLCVWRDITEDRRIRADVERKNRELETLLRISHVLARTLDMRSVLQMVVNSATELLELDSGAIYLARGEALYLGATTPPLPAAFPDAFRRAAVADHPRIGEALRTGRPVLVPDTRAAELSEAERTIIEARCLRTLLYVPLHIDVRAVGVLIMGTTGRSRAFTPAEIDLFLTMANQAAMTIENAQLFEGARREIAERERAEAARLEMQDQLVQAQRFEAIGTLASGIAHDFNNILGIIQARAGLLEGKADDPEAVRAHTQAIRTVADRAAGVVRQLLALGRQTPVRKEATSLPDLVGETIHLLRETFPASVALAADLDPDLPLLAVDPGQIHQVLLNISLNARDAMPGGGRLSFRGRVVPGEGLQGRVPDRPEARYLRLDIQDTGMGMDARTLEQIFDPFFTTKGHGKGTGLGLAVARGILRSHGGVLEAASEPGRGSTFTLHLPVTEAAPPPAPAAVETPSGGGGERILLIEDEPLLLEAMAELLAAKGYQVLAAPDGERGLDLLGPGVSLVVCDYGLPGISGEEVFLRMGEKGGRPPFLLCTGFLDPGKAEALRARGMAGILAKPWRTAEFLAAVRRLLSGG